MYKQNEKPYSWIEINSSAIKHNLAQYKKIAGQGVHIAAVIKCNAYGHGTKLISQLCQNDQNVTLLCTARLSEATLLRSQHITKPILVLSHIDMDARLIIKHDITVTVCDIETAKRLNTVAINAGQKIKIHVKIDTGMSRFGFLPDQAVQAIKIINKLSNIELSGIYTHCAEADGIDQTFTLKQVMRFNTILFQLEQQQISIPYKHFANTSATTTIENKLINMVRIGAGMYGLWSSPIQKQRTLQNFPGFSITQALTWKTTVAQIKTIPAGSFVGYNRKHYTSNETKIAFLPIGYTDGYDRRLSCKGKVLINNTYAPVLGVIGMNIVTIDVTHIKKVNINDEVILIGDYEQVRAHDIANLIESFNPREITARLNPTLTRIIYDQPRVPKQQFSRYTNEPKKQNSL